MKIGFQEYHIEKDPYIHEARRLYNHIKNRNKSRGIPFLFSFEEWLLWWEQKLGPRWQERRGRGKGKYVMARYEDKGPYSWDNVRCTTTEDNSKEYNFYRWYKNRER